MPSKLILLSYFLFVFFVGEAQTGHLDPSYNIFDNGMPAPGNVNDHIRDAHIYPNGKYLVGGDFSVFNGQPVNKLIRLHNNGQLDTSFNPGGTGPNGNIKGFLVLNNNKILIYGFFSTYNGVAVDSIALLSENGILDLSFSLPVNPFSQIYSIAEQSTGKILVVGTGVQKMVRITQNGTIDNSFNEIPASALLAKSYTDDHDNIYILGTFSQFFGHVTKNIARLNPDGWIDTSFSIPAAYGNANDIVVNNDSTIVACGEFNNVNIPGLFGYYKTFANGQIDTTFHQGDSWAHYSEITKDSLNRYYVYWNNNINKKIKRLLPNGTIDPTFNEFSHGAGNAQGWIFAIRIEATGKILLAGRELTRRNADGTNDETFLSPYGVNGKVMVVKTLPDGKAYIGGAFSGYNNVSRNGIARLLPDGQLDNSFDPGSGAVVGVSTYEQKQKVYAIEVQNDGKILVGGGFIKFNTADCRRLVRLNTDGSIDTSFIFNAGFDNTIYDIAIQTDGKILVCGEFTAGMNIGCGRILRLNIDGSVDNTFQHIGAYNNTIRTMKVLANGQILLGGDFTYYNNQPIARFCRINADGSLDNSFSSGTGPNNIVVKIEEDAEGNILVLSDGSSYNGDQVNGLFRITSSGLLDTLFVADSSIHFFSLVQDFYIQPDGKILVIGYFSNTSSGFQIGRLLQNGTIDSTFYSPTMYTNHIESIDLFADGSILAGGDIGNFFGISKRGVFKVNNDIPFAGCQFLHAEIASVSDINCGDSALARAYSLGGFTPYSYSWDNSPFIENDTTFITNTGGIHYLSIIDSIGCSYTTGFLVNGPISVVGFDNTVSIITSSFRSGFQSEIDIIGVNRGCLPSTGSLILVKDSMLFFLSSIPLPDQIIGDSLIWNFNNQTYDQTDIISSVLFMTNPNSQIGDSVHVRTIITPTLDDRDTNNNSYYHSFPIINGYDPNIKSVYPEGECIPHYIEPGEKMRYTVRFQNTGNAEAINIHLNDTISQFLDISTLRIIASSHEMFTEIHSNNVVNFAFNNILLPDSISNPAGSIGFVIFEIDQFTNLFDETRIENKVEIYFDYNPAIITNQVYNTIRYEAMNSIESLSLVSCDSVLWNGTYYDTSGIYTYRTQNIYGCDSVITLHLTVPVVINEILQNGGILSSSVSNANYQWLDCDHEYEWIPGEVNQTFTPLNSGNYALELTVDACSYISDCATIDFSNIEELSRPKISIYPNPVQGSLHILGENQIVGSVEIVSSAGQLIIRKDSINGDIDVSMLEPGIYFIQVRRMHEVQIFKFIKS